MASDVKRLGLSSPLTRWHVLGDGLFLVFRLPEVRLLPMHCQVCLGLCLGERRVP